MASQKFMLGQVSTWPGLQRTTCQFICMLRRFDQSSLLLFSMSFLQGKSLQFDQWRIVHIAEFGICNFSEISLSVHGKSEKQKERKQKDTVHECNPDEFKSQTDSHGVNQENIAEEIKSSTLINENEDFQENDSNDNSPKYLCENCDEFFETKMKWSFHKITCVDKDFLDELPMEIKVTGKQKIFETKPDAFCVENETHQIMSENIWNLKRQKEHSIPSIVIDTFCKTETKTDTLKINTADNTRSQENDELSENYSSSEALKNISASNVNNRAEERLNELSLKNAFNKGTFNIQNILLILSNLTDNSHLV